MRTDYWGLINGRITNVQRGIETPTDERNDNEF